MLDKTQDLKIQSYRDRLCVPIEAPHPILPLFDQDGILLLHDYHRIVIGGRGPYVEALEEHIEPDSLSEKLDELWRIRSKVSYYRWLLAGARQLKVYLQQRPVDYADYVPGRYYYNPFDLYTSTGMRLIVPLRGK